MERICEQQCRSRVNEKSTSRRKGKRKRSRSSQSSLEGVLNKPNLLSKLKNGKKTTPSRRSRQVETETRANRRKRKRKAGAMSSSSTVTTPCRCAKMTAFQKQLASLPVLKIDGAEMTTTTTTTTTTATDLDNVVAVDCEMVGVGWKMQSALGRCSMVDGNGSVLLDTYVIPPSGVASITDYRTRFSGIRRSHMRDAMTFDVATNRARDLIRGRIVVGHALENDFQVMGFRVPEVDVRDTSHYPYLLELAHKVASERDASSSSTTSLVGNATLPKVTKSLKSLSRHILGRKIQGKQHDSIEDARAALTWDRRVREVWERELSSSTSKTEAPKDFSSRRCCRETEARKRRRRATTETSEEIAEFVKDHYWEDFPETFC